jgi:hypothetical protein
MRIYNKYNNVQNTDKDYDMDHNDISSKVTDIKE